MAEQRSYSLSAKLRLALSTMAAEASDVACTMVPTCGEDSCRHDELIDMAVYLNALARDAVTLAVACERQRGVPWREIAGALGDADREAARDLYDEATEKLRRTLVLAWLDPDRSAALPEWADHPTELAGRLDGWTVSMRRTGHAWPESAAEEPPEHPVSDGLPAMSLVEHAELVTEGSDLVEDLDDTDAAANGLERRKVELFEWQIAEELADPHGDDDRVRRLRTKLGDARRHADAQ